LAGTYRVKLNAAYFLPHAGLASLALLGFAILWGASGWKVYVSAVVFVLLSAPLLFILWRTIPTWRDELQVYENGFTYKSRKGLQTCLWKQISYAGGELDTGNRLKFTSVEKRGGEKIDLAYKMRGRDLLDHLYSDYEYSLIPASEKATPADLAAEPRTLGALVNTYHVKMGILDYLPLFLLFFLTCFGVVVYIASRDILSIYVCSLPPVLIFLLMVRMTFSERGDELNVFENGFTYLDRRSTVSCLWSEIEDYSQTSGAFGGAEKLTSIKKANGPWIPIANNMQGKDQLWPHLGTVIKWEAPEE
jgi:hypothetical protein